MNYTDSLGVCININNSYKLVASLGNTSHFDTDSNTLSALVHVGYSNDTDMLLAELVSSAKSSTCEEVDFLFIDRANLEAELRTLVLIVAITARTERYTEFKIIGKQVKNTVIGLAKTNGDASDIKFTPVQVGNAQKQTERKHSINKPLQGLCEFFALLGKMLAVVEFVTLNSPANITIAISLLVGSLELDIIALNIKATRLNKVLSVLPIIQYLNMIYSIVVTFSIVTTGIVPVQLPLTHNYICLAVTAVVVGSHLLIYRRFTSKISSDTLKNILV